MGHEQRFSSHEDVKKWLGKWFAAKGRVIHKLPERWENVEQTIEHTLNKALFIVLSKKKTGIHTYTPGNL